MNIINQIKTLLNMEVKLEQMKLADGMTVLEADSFEPEMEVFILTEDEQKIPVPVGEYEMEDGRILVVMAEGVIAEIKEKMEEEEEVKTPEAVVEEKVAAEVEAPTASVTPKKTIESVTKESFFSEIEALKAEIVELKAQIETSKVEEIVELAETPKPISFNPENTTNVEGMRYAQNRSRTIMDSIYEKLNK
jgi:phage I-like protein